MQIIRHVIKMFTFNFFRVFIYHHHPGMVPSLTGMLCDKFFGKVVVEIL